LMVIAARPIKADDPKPKDHGKKHATNPPAAQSPPPGRVAAPKGPPEPPRHGGGAEGQMPRHAPNQPVQNNPAVKANVGVVNPLAHVKPAAPSRKPLPVPAPQQPQTSGPPALSNQPNSGGGNRQLPKNIPGPPQGDKQAGQLPRLPNGHEKHPSHQKDANKPPHQPDKVIPIPVGPPASVVVDRKNHHPQTIPTNIPKQGLQQGRDPQHARGPHAYDPLRPLLDAKNQHDVNHHLAELRNSPQFMNHPQRSHLNLDRVSGIHQQRLEHSDSLRHWDHSSYGQTLRLTEQFQLQRRGDIGRQMNLVPTLVSHGGWKHRQHGIVGAAYTASAMSVWYAGGGCYPQYAWCPKWSPWVDWAWWDHCAPLYDPRPIHCRPVVCQPSGPWVYYNSPTWSPLPVAACGTWIDVPQVAVPAGSDLQLLAVRFVDNGHPEQNLGPRYRAWVRNNSSAQIVLPFNVVMLASNEPAPSAELPQSGAIVPSLDGGETTSLDIRLPLQANRLGVTPEGVKIPFAFLHVLVDATQQIPEVNEENNGAVLARTEILPVDPAAFTTDLTAAAPGTELTIAGEGFGPEPGQLMFSVVDLQVQAEISGWYDLGIRFTVPDFGLSSPLDAELLVVRGDGAASNPLTVRLVPASMIGAAVPLDLPPAEPAP
jgi:hypothetical protein